ncbi:hypothetical protein DY000_02048677 [Brassica cretica]|uniref:Uncharacterized protein n=1 Tax=Brassica cretica TaxID=69181 RepID=A0ABQ7F398_BRACR|nr:hypothetical protein DY000_02048677 [Brassica cretica]
MTITLQVSREDIADILQLANGPDNLFMQQRSIPDNIPAVPDEHPRADTTEIGSHQSCQPVGQTSIDKDALTSLDKAPSPSIDRRYECGLRAYDIYGARKFRWEQKDEYGVYRDESGYARSVAGEMIPVTKDNIRIIVERASLFEESHICLPEHVTSFTPTKLAPEIYTKDEINEMVTGICGAQEKLGDELKTLHILEKEATTSPSIDANKATSIDVKPQTSLIPAEPENLDTIRKKDQQPAISIDICTITSIDSKFAAMEDTLQTYEDMHDRFTSPIVRYLDTLSAHMMNTPWRTGLRSGVMTSTFHSTSDSGLDSYAEWLQKEVNAIHRQFTSQHQISTSIDRERSKSINSKAPASTDKHLVASIDTTSTPDAEQLIQNKMESMHEELNELSAYAYDKIGWHQFNIENTQERLQNISNEKLGDELKTLVDDTYQPLDRGYNELFGSMAEMRTEIDSMQHIFEKEATTSPSIDANKATSIDVNTQTSQIPAEPESLAAKKDEWEIAYISTKINDIYNPLNNNVDWLSTRIDLLQQDLDTIRKKDPQPATSIDICTITSIDSQFAAMEDRLQSYEDMHDSFTSPIMRYLDTLSTQMMNAQRDIGTLNDQHDFQEEGSTSIDRFRRASLDVRKPTEHLPYTATEVDQITSQLYTAIDTMEDRFEKRCDDIYFPFDVRLSGLDSHAGWLQKEVKAIQRQLASQHHISASINRKHSKSIDSKAPGSTDKHLVASIDTTPTPDDEQLIQNKMELMHEELNELSAYGYDKI